MAVPKKKHSKSRSRKRRTGKGVPDISKSICQRCSSDKLPHRVCRVCGYYGDKKVIEEEE